MSNKRHCSGNFNSSKSSVPRTGDGDQVYLLLYHTSSLKNLVLDAGYWLGPQKRLAVGTDICDLFTWPELPHNMVSEFQYRASWRSQADLWCHFSIDMVLASFKGKKHRSHFSVGGVSMSHCRRAYGRGDLWRSTWECATNMETQPMPVLSDLCLPAVLSASSPCPPSYLPNKKWFLCQGSWPYYKGGSLRTDTSSSKFYDKRINTWSSLG